MKIFDWKPGDFIPKFEFRDRPGELSVEIPGREKIIYYCMSKTEAAGIIHLIVRKQENLLNDLKIAQKEFELL